GALKGTWIDARTYYKGSSKGAELLQQGKVLLRPVLRDLDATFTDKRGRYSGPLDASIDWVFLSGMRQDSVLHTVPMRTRLDLVTTHRTEVMTELLRHAARRLAEDPDLPAVLAGIHKEAVLAGRGEAIPVKTPTPLAFEGRKDMLSTLVKAVTTIQTSDGHGSGFLITNDGYIITNEHVVEKDPVVKVRFEQGFTLDGRVVKVNRDLDLALVKVDATDLPALSIGDDTGLLLGEELFAIGTPLDVSLGQSVSRGILSGTREIEDRRLLQTDVSINPGNSGGPLVDENGKVVGVATLKLSGEGLEGLGFAVPISVALDMLNLQFAP
ncbi:MAG: trypsin-like peptidase domain-containing protein, partial [Flavobacteriales bacterium]|nr:trypsin-like peptidase domain-containing protein [Flavobacteriales bacterium]